VVCSRPAFVIPARLATGYLGDIGVPIVLPMDFSAALVLSKLLANLLIGVTPHDPASFSLAFALVTVATLLASAMPASRAARTGLISVSRLE
jgi:hypothetical protein